MGGMCGSAKDKNKEQEKAKKNVNAIDPDAIEKNIEKLENEVNGKIQKNAKKLEQENPIDDFLYNENPKNNFIEKFRVECLKKHNVYRKSHQVDNLKFNAELNEIAQSYAEKLASTNSFNHSGAKFNNDNMGENLYMQGGREMLGEMPADSWYDEIKDYNFKNPQNKTGVVGHFTQLVWKGSQEIGIGCAKADDGSYYVVANYYPAGNWMGEELTNVLEKI